MNILQTINGTCRGILSVDFSLMSLAVHIYVVKVNLPNLDCNKEGLPGAGMMQGSAKKCVRLQRAAYILKKNL